ncbi:MAG: efflux RND transporter periplasmic adaptor subunit [Desulfovibrio sp.]|nr:efflux RND transporter periplasmic adaptor subunit [Desulfovibrio sp.]
MRSRPIFLTLLLIAGVTFGYVFASHSPQSARTPSSASGADAGTAGKTSAMADTAPGSGERKVLFWYDPMYPGTKFDKPGKSPFMDMDLVPRYTEDDTGAGIRIDPVQRQNMAISTEAVRRGRLNFSIDIPANVEFNDYQLARVQPRAEGFVEKTYALAVGDMVKAGQPLVDVTVPGWTADQSEYLLLRSQKAAPEIVNGVRERLRLSGMPEEMLKAVDASGRVQTRLMVSVPITGVITAIEVYPGMNVDKNMTLTTIQGVNPVWVTADVPERNLHLANGKRIRVSVPAYPDRTFFAQSATLLPKADQATRTVPLRLSLDNPEGLLKPGLTASIRLRGESDEALLIPTQSLIDLGDEKRVIVRVTDGSFVPRRVTVLRDGREQTAVLSGLDEGEEVVVTSLFLIDSEANLRGALERMRADGNTDESHDHGGSAQ